jgi:hypothetical protein
MDVAENAEFPIADGTENWYIYSVSVILALQLFSFAPAIERRDAKKAQSEIEHHTSVFPPAG